MIIIGCAKKKKLCAELNKEPNIVVGNHFLTLIGTVLKIYVKLWGGVQHHPLLETKNQISDRSYRNRLISL